jgi:hypothetical protein
MLGFPFGIANFVGIIFSRKPSSHLSVVQR